MHRSEQQLRLIQAVYRVESGRQHGAALDELRVRCEALLDVTAPQVAGEARLVGLVNEIRTLIRD
jgi:hypothetical protein